MSKPGFLRRAARERPEYALAIGVNLAVLVTVVLMFSLSLKLIAGWLIGSTVTFLLNLAINRPRGTRNE